MATESRIETLFSKYLDESITREEFNEFWSLMGEQDIQTLSPQLQNLWIRTEGIAPVYSDEEWNRKLKALIQKAEEEDAEKEGRKGRNGYAKNGKIIRMWKLATAACIILLVGTVTFLAISKRGEKPPVEIAKTNDVPAPSNTRAVITLADGSKVYLDSADNGTIAQENNVAVVKNSDGSIVYSHEDTKTQTEITYNTLFNPRGSKVISLTLSDGTKVWLNSESSLRYPASFASSAVRDVEITGEAYFEVAHDPQKKFYVRGNGVTTEVLGTHFNVNTYSDEAAIRVTLLEGSVKVSANNNSVTIKPSQQASINRVNPGISRIEVQTVDTDEATAWVNGQFSFNRTNIVSIMKQVERWYDVEVEFKDDVRNNDFTGGIARTENVSQVLKMLEKTGVVKFTIEGKRIIVTK